MEINNNSLKLLHPFSLIISGVTQSGKTEFVKKLLMQNDKIINSCPKRIVISYTKNQQAYRDMTAINPNIEFRQGLDFEISEFNPETPTILIIDDQMNDAVSNEKIQTFFTQGIHHNSVSLVLLTQNLYPQGKFGRDIRLNCHYIVIMKSPTFASQVQCFGRQVFPQHSSFLFDAYKKATLEPYSYLFINLHPLCDERARVSQGIFPEEVKFIFVPK